ncbi:aldo/keto reductase [Streptomyces xinghaiensis]|uniref:Aldo/keto reductase n=2 Tax=Streptomyces TaxID=1883 RepID=A0A3R7LL20_9ACTN|nr:MULTISPECIES: aldo/keto reductase [Streptomyces]KNE83331.1 aldo/keto reductase [Streptomyces fradiae]OFA44225.1 aldo/keto reductase [Streptomyces fradiae]PQM20583.1 aldo/keto reductase [Streptomyces xinghaiensis]RKM92525.1 aldo/keto reductase [Streptomyces xinghaiensis]RNC70492.1 aldo/keto reductase [Streptomyces xinghaiensis]
MTGPGTISIAGKEVPRLGLSTMRLTGPGTWGAPPDPGEALAVLRTAVHEHGIAHIDTADAYGPHTAEDLIRDALHPYPDHVLIATKVGMIRPGPNVWTPLGRPDYLRAAVEGSLRRLGTETLELCYLHRVDEFVPLRDQLGELAALQREGKVRHIGLSKVTSRQVRVALDLVKVAAVQNVLNMSERYDPVLELCRDHGIPYVPCRPLDAGRLAGTYGIAAALQWLTGLGEHLAPIPGTSSTKHLAEIVTAFAE